MITDIVELAEAYSRLDKGIESLSEEDKRIALREYDAFCCGFNKAYSKAMDYVFNYMLEKNTITEQKRTEFFNYMRNKLI